MRYVAHFIKTRRKNNRRAFCVFVVCFHNACRRTRHYTGNCCLVVVVGVLTDFNLAHVVFQVNLTALNRRKVVVFYCPQHILIIDDILKNAAKTNAISPMRGCGKAKNLRVLKIIQYPAICRCCCMVCFIYDDFINLARIVFVKAAYKRLHRGTNNRLMVGTLIGKLDTASKVL